MNAEMAKGLLTFFLSSIDNEFKTTKKVISAVPQDKSEWKPDPKSMYARELCNHITTADIFFLDGIINGEFAGADTPVPATVAEILKNYEGTFNDRLAKVKALPVEKLTKPVSFFGVMELPAVAYLNLMLMHTAHHRGQLSTYLRPMGSKVPSIYGGSADEPFNPGA